MQTFVSKPEYIRAEQWLPGRHIPGVRYHQDDPAIVEHCHEYRHFLYGSRYQVNAYRILWNEADCGGYLSSTHFGSHEAAIESIPGYLTALTGSTATFMNEGRARIVHGLHQVSLETRRRETIRIDDPLVRDYARFMKWPVEPELRPYVRQRTNIGCVQVGETRVPVEPGDWVIEVGDGYHRLMRDQAFRSRYRPDGTIRSSDG